MAPVCRPVRFRSGGGAGRAPGSAGALFHGVRDDPYAQGASGKEGRTVLMATSEVVPVGSRCGWLVGPGAGLEVGQADEVALPGGPGGHSRQLFSLLFGLRQFPLSKPPERAFWKTPLSYHFLASGSDGSVVAASTGRFRKVTTWVPLEKVQSVRRVQGPLQRAFNLASVYLDAAGRRVRAELRDREVGEADAPFRRTRLAEPCRPPASIHPVDDPDWCDDRWGRRASGERPPRRFSRRPVGRDRAAAPPPPST